MITLLRHLLAIAVLPFTVTVIVPLWIARRNGITPVWPGNAADVALAVLGVAALLVGLALFVTSLRRFATERAPVRSPRDAVGIPLTYLQLSI